MSGIRFKLITTVLELSCMSFWLGARRFTILIFLSMRLKKILLMLKWSFRKITVCQMKLRNWLENCLWKIRIKGWAILLELRKSCCTLGWERSIGPLLNLNPLRFPFHPIWTGLILILMKSAWAKKDSQPKSKKNIEHSTSEEQFTPKRKNDKAAKNICPRSSRPTPKSCLKVAKKTKKESPRNRWATFWLQRLTMRLKTWEEWSATIWPSFQRRKSW